MSTAEAIPSKATGPAGIERRPSTFTTNLGRVLGAVGVVLWVSTPLTWILTADFGPLVWGKLLGGAICIGVYLSTNADFFSRLAGARSTGLMAMSGATVVVVLGLVGVVNFVAYKNPKEFDLTREGLYTLSEQTINLLGRLKDDVQVMAFYPSYDPAFGEVKETLERYKTRGSGKLGYEMIDPQTRPDLADKYQITEHGPRIVITSRGQDARAKDTTEQELTNAIVRVAEQTSKSLYFLTGHGEGDITDGTNPEGLKTLADAIGAEGYTVQKLSLIGGDEAAELGAKVKLDKADSADKGAAEHAGEKDGLEVPASVSVLVVAGARSKLLEPEIAAIERYLNRGGRLIALLDPDTDTGLETLLKQWKIEVRKDLVVDTNPLNRLLGLGPAAPMVQPSENSHTITRDLTAPAVMMTVRSLTTVAGGEAGVDAQQLVTTGQSAWGETHIDPADGSAAHDDKDFAGPLTVGVVATKPVAGISPEKSTSEARLVVYGDSDWVSNKYLTMQGNNDLILNSVNWLAEQEEKISIRPKARASSQLFLSGEDLGKLKFFSMDIFPVLLVAVGLSIVLIRRQK